MAINKSKFKVVVFYGTIAVGKYTVAKEFQKQTGFKFFHNHLTHDLAREFYDRETVGLSRLIERLRFIILEEITKEKLNVVMTHCYSSAFVSKTGLSDPDYMKKLEKIVGRAGGKIYFIHLETKPEEIIKRVRGKSRKNFKKLKNPVVARKILGEERKLEQIAPVKNNFNIDNTNLSPKQVVKKVLEIINS